MRRLFTIFLLGLSAAALLVSAPVASAAKRKAAKPSITRVMPMRVSVGARLTIVGKNFNLKRKANTVIFRAPNGRSAFAKPRRASRRKLVVVVPAAVSRLLTVSDSRQKPTRLKLRVLAGQFSRFTPRRLSPVVTGPGGSGGGSGGDEGGGSGIAIVCNTGGPTGDHDGDLLTNAEEGQYQTDPCLADTDKDEMVDGWEFWSAKDLNIKAVPYPGKRPYPNPLDPSDGAGGDAQGKPVGYSEWDFDGDGLRTYEEYRAWRATGSGFDRGRAGGLDRESPLSYSDGTQTSWLGDPLPAPAWAGPAYGLPAPAEAYPATYDMDGNGSYGDDERDADRDGLSNWLESSGGPGQPSWWPAYWSSLTPGVEPWPKTYYGAFDERPYTALDLADDDVDGDTLLDGEDDQDFDDWTNITELYYRGGVVDVGGGTMKFVNAFNPCAPDESSRTCDLYKPFN